jgi:predicted pyridoxine 5'-phosphate oxidase superfamily flavin-nucleotide-binding protein
MANVLLTEEIRYFLENKEFINIATCDFSNRPNVAPKFVVKIEGDFIYLADYVIGRTFENLKVNPRVSLSTVNIDTLVGYQVNGSAEIIDKGAQHRKLLKNVADKQIDFSVKRIIEGVHAEKKYKSFEVTFPEKVVILKIKVEEIVEIGPTGKLARKKL